MDYHITYDDKIKIKMAGKMILNKIMGSRKRLVIALLLIVMFVDFCILSSPRAEPGVQRHPAAAAARRPPARDTEEAAGRQHRRPTRWAKEQEQELRRELEEDGEDTGGEQEDEDQPRPGTSWDAERQEEKMDVDAWDKLNEVNVDGDGSEVLKLSPVSAQKARPAAAAPIVRLEVEAGEENIDVKLNGQSLMVPEINNRTRGLHALVLEQNSHAVMARRRFDTVLKNVHREVIHFLDAVRPGRIIVLATKDDMSFNMHSDLRFKLTELGSQFIPNLGFRDQWAMVTIKGSEQTLGETFSPAPVDGEYGGPLFLRVDLRPGSLPDTPPCDWPESEESGRRHTFCDHFEGYPGLCRCLQPHPILPESSDSTEDVDSIYVAVMATHRPYYLYRALRSLAFAPGAVYSNIIVYLENSLNQELEALVTLFGFKIRYIAAKPNKNIKGVIGNRVMDIFDDVFTNFMEAEYVLFIEEDLECSPDIFRYFGQTRSLLVDDPSLFSVSALNRQSYRNTSHVAHVAYRVDSLPSAGFLLHRNVYETDIKPVWPQYAWTKDWTTFLNRVVRGDREVVVPDVNRVYHIGLDSQFVNTGLYEQMSKNLSVNPDPSAALQDVTRLHKLNYEEDLLATLEAGVVIRDYGDLCSAGNMTVQFRNQNKTEILYFKMDKESDISTWFYLAKCWGLWPYSTTGHHGGLWRFWLENKKGFLFHMVFIGVPFSRYSSHKPADVEPFRASAADMASVGGPLPSDPAGSDSSVSTAAGSAGAAAGSAPLRAVGRPPSGESSSRGPPEAAAPAVGAAPPRAPSPASPSSSPSSSSSTSAAAPVRQASSRASSPRPPAPAAAPDSDQAVPAPVPAVPAPVPSRPRPAGRPGRPVNVRNRVEV
ncbi:protein O-linked-mannose beta-1,2-N-acetylglucosaminyltransferase 1-like [Amphibalanus amphitrite]|uniref:protein O-linked-mannose beta-1,2-N-acetylglucosaminyltransferase 1-like n=1 Tax=Amphibalanus amphitrite TaxID=1232801 RepID=UPI001C90A092|nr:protein O-linked-mannose beta-1,2-N-acetylglucosaminyltransferase 1-like [Amphibalanus amphitrite]